MSTNFLPKYAFFISGTGRHVDRLQAFDRALGDAGPLAHNLVSVSSIIPSECKIVTAEEGFSMLTPGQIVFCVMSRQDANEPGAIASASIGVARPKDSGKFGYISEYHSTTSDKEVADEKAKKLALEMLSVKQNISTEKLDLKLLEATTASIKHAGDNEWVCAIALCVFVL